MKNSKTILEIEKKKRSVYTLRFNHKCVDIAEIFISKYHLYKGKQIDENLICQMEAEFEGECCYQKGLSLLTRRGHFKKELTFKLKQRNFSDSAISITLERLEKEGAINQLRTAKFIAESKIERESIQKIKVYLMKKGCPEAIVNKVLAVYNGNEEEKAYVLLQKKASYYNDITQDKEKQKLYRFLLTKGFSYSDVKKAYRRYIMKD